MEAATLTLPASWSQGRPTGRLCHVRGGGRWMAVRPIEYMHVAALLCERLPKGQDRTALLTVVFAGWLPDRL